MVVIQEGKTLMCGQKILCTLFYSISIFGHLIMISSGSVAVVMQFLRVSGVHCTLLLTLAILLIVVLGQGRGFGPL